MGNKHCLAVGAVGGDVAVDVREVVVLVSGHCLGSEVAFAMMDVTTDKYDFQQRVTDGTVHLDKLCSLNMSSSRGEASSWHHFKVFTVNRRPKVRSSPRRGDDHL